MTQAQLIAAMLAAAAPVTKHYWTDLGHDAKLLADAEPGDSFLWAPYESGSRIIVLHRGDKPNKRANEIFDAMQSQDGDHAQWHRIVVRPGDGGVILPLCSEDARADAKGASNAAQTTPFVSELHM